MNQAISNAVKNRSTSVTALRTGSKGPVSSDLAKVKDDAEKLPDQLAKNKETFRGVLLDYTALQIPASVKREQFNNDLKLRYVAQADAQASEIRSAMSDMHFAVNNLDQFPGANLDALRQGIRVGEASITELTYDVRRCIRNAGPCGTYVPQKMALPTVPARTAGATRAELEATVAMQAARIKKSQDAQNALLYNDQWMLRRFGFGNVWQQVEELRKVNKEQGGMP
jgi:ABC-type transporter Mla subunit MlaD